MNENDRERVVIVSGDLTERALIAAQLQQDVGCRVEGVENMRDALAALVLTSALVIVDLSKVAGEFELSKFRAAARGVPVLVLASRADGERIKEFESDPARVLFRPFTVGDVVERAGRILAEAYG